MNLIRSLLLYSSFLQHLLAEFIESDNPFEWVVDDFVDSPTESSSTLSSEPTVSSTTITTTTTTSSTPLTWPDSDRECPVKCDCNPINLSVNCSSITEKYPFQWIYSRSRSLLIENSKFKGDRLNYLGKKDFPNLTNLTFINNDLKGLSGRIFKFVPNIKFYTISHCTMEQVGNFPKNAVTVDISFNKIEIFNLKHFRDLSKCIKADFSNNKITKTVDKIKHRNWAPRLMHINWSNNKFKEFPWFMWNLPVLQTLDLRNNLLEESYPSGHNTRYLALQELYLDNNRIESVDSKIFYVLPRLRVLTLTGNRILSIKGEIHYFSFFVILKNQDENERNTQTNRKLRELIFLFPYQIFIKQNIKQEFLFSPF